MLQCSASDVVFGAEALLGTVLLGGTLFTIGRLMHGIVFSFMLATVMRIGGMALTFTGFFVLIVGGFYFVSKLKLIAEL